jgi:hypothetical protein
MPITVKHNFVSAIPDSGDVTIVQPSNWNADHTLIGLGTMAEQDANNVNITGGSVTGVTVNGYIPTTQKGVANGVATLDAGGKVPVSELPAAVLGALNYQGTWNASTNTPTLTSSVGTKGYYYVVNVAGSTNLDGVTDWVIGDWAVFNGSVWQKVDNTDAVTSVNGYTGTVVLSQTDISGTVPTSRTISAGTGLSGGGDLSANRTLSIDATVATLTGAQTLTNKSISGASNTLSNIGNSSLTNSAITINSVSTSLGGSINVGTVTSVAASAGTGISITGSPITSSGTLNITNTAPDQTVAIASGTGISVTGTYPNFTVTNTSPSSGGTVTSVTGTAPVVSSGGNTPAISMAAANTTTNGYLTSTDWNTFNSKGSVTSVGLSAPSIFTVSGSPVTGSGTLALSYSGTALPAVNGGTGLTAVGTAGNVLTSNGTTWVSQAVPVATASYVRTSFTATVGQTTFSVTYTAPYIEVYQNGALLNATDYTATNGTSVVLATGASTGDIIETIAYNSVPIGGGGGTPGGSDTQIQFNSSGTFGANANFTYTNDAVNIPFGTSNSATSSAKIALALSMMS